MSSFEKKDLEDISSLDLHVKTNAKCTEIKEFDKEEKLIKMDVKALPEKGKANIEIIKFFTRLTKRKCRIVSGATSKRKVIKLD